MSSAGRQCICLGSCPVDVQHLVAQSINIDTAALQSIKRGILDPITFKYDEAKIDKRVEFVWKTVYSNHQEPCVCVFTTLGHYLSINSEIIDGTEHLFIAHHTRCSTTSQNFVHQLLPWVLGMQVKLNFLLQTFQSWGEKGQCHSCCLCNNLPSFYSNQ